MVTLSYLPSTCTTVRTVHMHMVNNNMQYILSSVVPTIYGVVFSPFNQASVNSCTVINFLLFTICESCIFAKFC